MACNIQNEVVKAQRDIFKTIKESSKFKKAEAKLNDILANGINLEELKKEQKVNGKKNLVTRTTRGTKTDTVDLPLNFINVEEVKVKKEGTNFFYRLQTNKFDVTVEDEVDVVITDKFYKEIKVTYTIEDTSKKQDLQTECAELQKIADGIRSGDSTAAVKFFEDKAKEVSDAFDGVYGGIHQIIEKIRSDANIPVPPADAVVIVDKVKKHTGSNVINLEDPVSITNVKARKANTNFFFKVTQYKFLKESNAIIATNSYEEYIVEYRGKGSNTNNNNTNELPSKDSIVSDIQQGFDALSTNIGNAVAAVNNVAGQFGKDISGLVSAASSGSLIQDALAQAQNQPATYTRERTVRDKNTNAITLEGLVGGEAGIIEVFTRREDQSFFSQMQKGKISGWRIESEEEEILYIFEPRAEIKVKYTQETDPPADSGVATVSNDKDVPKLDPCKDIPALSVKIQEEIRKDVQTGQTQVVTSKVKESKPPTRLTPTVKAEPATNVAESPTIVNSAEAPTSALSVSSMTVAQAYRFAQTLAEYETEFGSKYWTKRRDDSVKTFKEAMKSPVRLELKKKINAGGFKSLKAYQDSGAILTPDELKVRETIVLAAITGNNIKEIWKKWERLVIHSKFEIIGRITTEQYEKTFNEFQTFEASQNSAGPEGTLYVRRVVQPEDIAQFNDFIRAYHLSKKNEIIEYYKLIDSIA